MTDPTCRDCYMSTLTTAQRDRFLAEPVTTCVYRCPEHQARYDAIMDRVSFRAGMFEVKGTITGRLPRDPRGNTPPQYGGGYGSQGPLPR